MLSVLNLKTVADTERSPILLLLLYPSRRRLKVLPLPYVHDHPPGNGSAPRGRRPGAEVDYVGSITATGFAIRNPNAISTCGLRTLL